MKVWVVKLYDVEGQAFTMHTRCVASNLDAVIARLRAYPALETAAFEVRFRINTLCVDVTIPLPGGSKRFIEAAIQHEVEQ